MTKFPILSVSSIVAPDPRIIHPALGSLSRARIVLLRLLLALTLGTGMAWLLSWALSAYAMPAVQVETIVVNSLADVVGVDGACTLREAVLAANTDSSSGTTAGECAAGSGLDVIDLTGISGTIYLTSTLPEIATDMVLDGPGLDRLTIDGQGNVRVISIVGGNVTISGLRIANGFADGHGGGILIDSTDTVTLTHCTFHNNQAKGASGTSACSSQAAWWYGGGGAVFLTGGGELDIVSSTFSGNVAIGGNGGSYGYGTGGGGGGGAFGGGLFSDGGIVRIISSAFAGNRAVGGSGGPRGPGGSTGCRGAYGGGQYDGLGGGGRGGSSQHSDGYDGNFGGGGGGGQNPSGHGGVAGFGGGHGGNGGGGVGGAGGGGGGMGGGVFNWGGVVTIIDSTFQGNQAVGGNGPDNGDDGKGIASAVFNSGTLSLENTSIVSNTPPILGGYSPPNGATEVSVDRGLSWDLTDSNGDQLLYGYGELTTTIAFGTSPSALIESTDAITSCTPSLPLAPQTTYYWVVTATDGLTLSSSGLLSFTTTTTPTADFDAVPRIGAVPLMVHFADQAISAEEYLWTFGDGNTSTAISPSHEYVISGVFTVSLTVSNSVSSDVMTRAHYITAYHSVRAGFVGSPTAGLWPLSVTFTNTSEYANRYVWDYGDGLTSTVAALTHVHTYVAPAAYTVTLVASGPYDGDILTRTGYVVAYEYPVASFSGTPQSGTAPLLVNLVNDSLNATSYRWDFGDGSTSYAENPSHLYQHGGVYTVTLTASNPGGSDTLVRPFYITVYDPPSAGFYGAPTQGLAPLTVAFTNTSQHADSYLWDYGDGLTSTTTATVHTHTYSTSGVYTVSLTAFSPYGINTYRRTAHIAVYKYPVASFSGTPQSGTAPLLVNLVNDSLNATSYRWDFGDGSISYAENPSHLYQHGGVYTVTLTASNPGGSDTLIRPFYITVHDPPSAGFYGAPTQGLAPLTVAFTNTSQYADSYLWDYGDGLTSTTTATVHTHTYSTSGVYTVSLTARNAYGGNTHARMAYIGVYDPPTPDFSAVPLSGVAPLSVSFANLSQDATGYLWSFGDGETSAAVSPTHIYLAGGVYTVSLCALNPGSSAWVTRTNYITVHPAPLPSFTSAQRIGVGPLTVVFTNMSQEADTFSWDYGDGTNSTIAAALHTHTFTAPGVYTVTLTASNVHGSKSVTRSGYVAVFDSSAPTVYYVDGEGGSDLTGDGTQVAPWKTIGHALSQMAGTGLELRVASGTYDQDLGERFPITMKSGISVKGVGRRFTVVLGVNAEPVFLFPATSAFDSSTVLSDLKIMGGLAGAKVEGVEGNGTAPVIRDNWVTGNRYGIYVVTSYGSRAYPSVLGNRIVSNAQHGLYLVAKKGIAIAQPTVQGNSIADNGGSGVYCYATGAGYPYNHDYGLCSPALVRNVIAANDGDGITCHTAYCGGCSPSVEANIVAHNGGWGWGRQHEVTYLQSTKPTFVNNLIYANARGGAIFEDAVSVYSDKDAPIFVNNTVVHNGSYGILGGYPSIVNNIVWGHTSDLDAPVSSVSYSLVSQGIYGGQNHNISLNPQFVDAMHDDYHLLPTSPAVNAGDSLAPHLPDFDIDGDPRILRSVVDIGADEVACNIVDPTGGSITPGSGVTITFPSGAFSDTVLIHYAAQPVTHTGTMRHVELFYAISATFLSSGLPAELQPGQHYTVTLSYDPTKVPPDLDEAALALYYWDDGKWVQELTAAVDTELDTISATPGHFSLWAALAEGYVVYLPIVQDD